jgi:phytol kinase
MVLYILIIISVVAIVLAEYFKKKYTIPASLTRRFVHSITALVAAVGPYYVSKTYIVLISVLFALGLIVAKKNKFLSSINDVERTTYGDVYLPLGVALSALIFLPTNIIMFVFGVLVMALADPLAGLVGEHYGKNFIKIFNNKKSLEGSTAFFVATMVISIILFHVIGIKIIIVASVLTFIELISVFGLDNLILPIMGSLLAFYIF